MVSKIIKSIKSVILIIISLASTAYGTEYYKGWKGTHYQDSSGDHYTWIQYRDVYYGGNPIQFGHYPSYQAALDFANSNPEITHFFYVTEGLLGITQGVDYATDTEYYSPGYAEFFSGGDGNGYWYSTEGTHGYFKQHVVPPPKNYTQAELRTYLQKYPKILSPDASPYLEMDITLEEAFKIADSDPLITHFIVLQSNNYFHKTYIEINVHGEVRRFLDDLGKKQSEDTIVFFHQVLPSWLNQHYQGGIWIYSKKTN